MSAPDRQAAKKAYNDAGISVIISAFGSTVFPTTDNKDPTMLANELADFVTKYDLDGIDGKRIFFGTRQRVLTGMRSSRLRRLRRIQ